MSGPPLEHAVANPGDIRRLTVNTKGGIYDAAIAPRLIARLGDLLLATLAGQPSKPRAAALVVDEGAPRELAGTAQASLAAAGINTARIDLPGGEACKTVEHWHALSQALAAHKLTRSDAVVALGGGAVTDLAGFAAAAYQRGCQLVQCPTTLLSMVDASVGGKTGINLTLENGTVLKNYLGAFHQPALVLADTTALEKLPERQLRSGLAECLKHGMIAGAFGDPGLRAWTTARARDFANRDENALAELVERNVRVKAAVVATDERETAANAAGRALLNLGHTFAHAFETDPNAAPANPPGPPQTTLTHGEAVAIGLHAAARCAAHANPDLGWLALAAEKDLRTLDLPTQATGLPEPEELVERMQADKKARAGLLRLVLPTSPTTAAVTATTPQRAIHAAWQAVSA